MVYVFMLQPVETPVRVWHKKLAYIFFSCGSSSYICLVYTYILGYSSNKPHLAAAATSKASSHHITLHQRRGCRAADRTVRSRPSPNKLHGRWCFPSALLTSQTLWGVGTMSSQLQPGQERERESARALGPASLLLLRRALFLLIPVAKSVLVQQNLARSASCQCVIDLRLMGLYLPLCRPPSLCVFIQLSISRVLTNMDAPEVKRMRYNTRITGRTISI